MYRIFIDAEALNVRPGMTVAAALSLSYKPVSRYSVTGRPRGPMCGMGVCQECRVFIEGVQRLACQTLVADGMRVHRHRIGDAEPDT